MTPLKFELRRECQKISRFIDQLNHRGDRGKHEPPSRGCRISAFIPGEKTFVANTPPRGLAFSTLTRCLQAVRSGGPTPWRKGRVTSTCWRRCTCGQGCRASSPNAGLPKQQLVLPPFSRCPNIAHGASFLRTVSSRHKTSADTITYWRWRGAPL